MELEEEERNKIEEIKAWLEEEHDRQNFQSDRHKMRGDLMAYILLKKMKEVGLIGEYTLLYCEDDQYGHHKYRIRYVGDAEIKMSCGTCGWGDTPEEEGIPCRHCKNVSMWKPRQLEVDRAIERLGA